MGCGSFAVWLLAGTISASDGLDEAQTKALVKKYEQAKHWALKGVILVAMGPRWHPAGVPMILSALRDRDKRLRAYAVETLHRTEPETLRAILTKDLLDEVIRKQIGIRHKYYRTRIMETLKRLAPEVTGKTVSEWRNWWRKRRETYAPAAWKEPPKRNRKKGDGTVAEAFIDRAMDLHAAGLDLVICIDTTGSMQPTIDAARAGLADIVAMLQGITPRLRMGVVQYRDYEDYPEGARLEVPLSPHVAKVQDKLGKLSAAGGGDFPERVERGMESALGPKMGWLPSANKALVVIGDAPPHPDAIAKAEGLAKGAFEKPFGRAPSVVTGKNARRSIRPFVTSCIGVGAAEVSSETEGAFKRIAKAGGGAYGKILTNDASKGAREIVKHILTLSFGSRWAAQMGVFVEVYLTYRRERFIP